MTLSTKLTIAMVTLVAVTVAAIALFTYRNLEGAILPRALERTETHARLVASELESYARGARSDIEGFRSAVALRGIVRAYFGAGTDPLDGASLATWRERMASRFVAELESKPAYSQFRVIDREGREIVRVDRSGRDGAIQVLPDAELQGKSERGYFIETIKLKAGEVYVSRIDLNQENGVIETPYVPTLRVATPVFADDGRAFGIVIINLDMRPAFDKVRASVRKGGEIYVVNERGDYLVHPNRNDEFGSELGKPTRWQTDFPELAVPLRSVEAIARVTEDKDGDDGGGALATARPASGEAIGIIEEIPNAVWMAPAKSVRYSALIVGLVAVLCAGVLAVFIARSLTQPLVQMTKAVEGIGNGGHVSMSVQLPGEAGVLARAFERVLDELKSKVAAFEREVEDHRKTTLEHERSEQQVRLFGSAVESSNDAIVTQSLDGVITGWNAAAEQLFGYTADEAMDKSIDLIVPQDRHAEVRKIPARISLGEVIKTHETVRVAKDGREIQLSLSISPIKSRDGAIIGSTKIARDLTEIRLAQEALSESERMGRGIVETALDAFVQMDETGLVVDWNSQAERIFGWSRDEAIGRDVGELIVPEAHRTHHRERLTRLLREANTTTGSRFEIEAQRRNGAEMRVEFSVTAFQRSGTHVFNAFIRDLTDKIAAENQIRQAQKMDAVGQLTGGVAHDFNNILTVITGTIEILAEGVADRPELAGIANMIDEAAARGAELTGHLLAFARRQPLQPREIDVNTLILTTSKLLRPTLGEQIEIETLLADDPWLAYVDPNQLTTAILNLALNARDAMPQGGRLIIETINSYLDEVYAGQHSEVKPGEYVLIAISDTGSGIPPHLIDKVFEPFFTTKEIGKGTGLGLSMVYGFVKQSEGHIKVYSEEGHGTTIKLYLPKSRAFRRLQSTSIRSRRRSVATSLFWWWKTIFSSETT